MSDDDSGEELLASLLVAYDEAIGRGGDPPEIESVVEDLDLADRLSEAKSCVELLDRIRRLGSITPHVSCDAETVGRQNPGHALPASIGRFRIERELGRGGLGLVLLGHDPELGRQVAIKIPLNGFVAGGELEHRFVREAEAAARLSHPHLVALHEVGHDGTLPYLVCEYCTGPTLAQWLKARKSPVAPRVAATLVRTLAEAVHHAHSRGVLHRDIKPGNVILGKPEPASPHSEEVRADGAGSGDPLDADCLFPKLTDFGMAKMLESVGDLTRTGAVIGTPAYMAPEQAHGRQRDVDARADVYSLGAVLYELLTGVAPYRGTSDVDTLRRLLMDEPVAPRQLCSAVPRDLEAICLKCLARQTHARYPTAQHLAEDLGRFLSNAQTEARPLTTAGRFAKWARRRPAVAALAGVLAASAAIVLALVINYNARLTDEVARAEREADTSRQLLYTADVRVAFETFQANQVVNALDVLMRHVPRPGEEDLREFAWHYLRQQCEPETVDLVGHEGDVFAVAHSPDGRLLATAGMDGTARLWESHSGRLLHVLRGHTTEVTSVAFAPDGGTLASGSEDWTIRLWNPASGAAGPVLEGHRDHVMAVAFSPDGRFLASGGRDATVRIWEPKTGAGVATLEGEMDVVRSLAFARSGDLLFAADEVGNIHAWQTASWKRLATTGQPHEKLFALAVSRNDALVAAAGRRELIWTYELKDSKLKFVQELGGGHTEWIQSLAFSPTADVLASAGKDGIIRMWSTVEGGPIRTLLGHKGRVWSLSWSPDGRQLASAGADAVVKIWPTQSGSGNRYATALAPVNAPVFSSDGTSLVVADYAAGWSVWSPTRRSMVARVPTRYAGTLRLDLSSDDSLVATIRAKDGKTDVWRLESLQRILSLPVDSSSVCALGWEPGGHRLAYTIDDRTVVLHNVDSDQVERRFEYPTTVRWLAFTSDGRRLATASQSLDLRDVRTGRIIYSLPEAHREVTVARDRDLLAAASSSNVTLVDATLDPPQASTLVTVGSDVDGLAIHGNTLAVALRRPVAVSLWDLRTHQLLMRLNCDLEEIHGLAFSPDGKRLVATGRAPGRKGCICEWSIRTRPPTYRP